MSHEKRRRDDELRERGWMKQNTIDEPRLSECVELYESLGYEVHLEPATPNELEECRQCYALEEKTAAVKTIYTRPKKRR